MKKLYTLLSIIAVPTFLLLYSFSSGSPGGKTGSMGDGGNTCTDCHNGTAQSQTGWITSNIPPEGFEAGQTYTITATGTHSGVVKFGFELTAEDAFGSKIGTFTITDPSRTKFTNANKAITHTSGGTGVSGNSNTWSMNWTAPNPAPGMVKFNAAFNAANGNGATSGDVIYKSMTSYSMFTPPNPQITSVEPGNEQQGYIGELNITGSETTWANGVTGVSFIYHDDNSIFFNASQITVVNNELLTVEVSIPEDIAIGEYDVKVDNLTLENGFIVDIYDDINDNYLKNLVSVYPNPATGFIQVQAPESSDISIVDISGRLVEKHTLKNSSSVKINTSAYKSGLYFVMIAHNGTKFTKKLIVR